MNDALMRLIVGAYNLSTVFDVALIAYVLIEAQDDLHLKRTDTPSILKWRRRTFAAGGVHRGQRGDAGCERNITQASRASNDIRLSHRRL